MDNPKVSVLTLTYNQERYIVQTLESVLEQVTNFDYEMVICDDCSTDQTPEILQDYQHRYPNKIRLFLNAENIGLYRNMVQAFFACTGEYIAILEGDDYWTSPEKLQKQVDFLDTHPGCTICFHNVKSVSDTNLWEPVIFCPAYLKEISTIKDLILLNFIPTLSVMYRRGVVQEIPAWVSKLKMTDWPLHLLHAQQGDIGYVNEIMGVYRVHDRGIWSSLTQTGRIEEIIKMLETANIYFDYQYETLINESLLNFHNQLIEAAQLPLQQSLDRLQQTLAYEQSESQNHIQHLQNELAYARSLLSQAQTQLSESQTQLGESQTQLSESQIQLSESQIQLSESQTQLSESQTQLSESQTQLARSQSHLTQSQGVLAYTQSQLYQTQAEVQVWRDRTQQEQNSTEEIRTRFRNKRSHLERNKAELQAVQDRINAMETSKFWKLRKGWFKLKRSLGLPVNE